MALVKEVGDVAPWDNRGVAGADREPLGDGDRERIRDNEFAPRHPLAQRAFGIHTAASYHSGFDVSGGDADCSESL